ncbi:MAG: response regulator, partial [Verrucomicrobiia bacterium]
PRRALRTIRINLKEIEEQVRAAEKAAKALVEETSPKSLIPVPPHKTTRMAQDEPAPLVPANAPKEIPSSDPSLKAPGPMTAASSPPRPPATRTVSGMPQPMAPRPAPNAPELEGVVIENPDGRGELILVVDDEPEVAALITSMLIDSHYRVIALHDGMSAVQVYKKAGKYIDLVLLDYAMPVMDGEDVFEELRLINPSVGVILSSGFPPQAKLGSLLSRGLRGFMPKPYTRDKLVIQVKQALTLGVKVV